MDSNYSRENYENSKTISLMNSFHYSIKENRLLMLYCINPILQIVFIDNSTDFSKAVHEEITSKSLF